jgi:hypothetical protein
VNGAIGDDLFDYEEESANADEGVPLSQSLVIQRLLLTPIREEHPQRQYLPYSVHGQPKGM